MDYYIRVMKHKKNSNLLSNSVKNEIMDMKKDLTESKKVKNIPNWIFLLFVIGLLTALCLTKFS